MQLLTTTFLFTIILTALEGSISENTETMIALAISLTECQEALSERQFGKQTHDTYFVWSWHSHTKRVYGTLLIFSGIFPSKMKFNHSVLGSDEGRLCRLLCSLVHPKTQHLKSLFGADIVYLQQLQQVISNGTGGPQLLTQGCVYANRAESVTNGRDFSPSVT